MRILTTSQMYAADRATMDAGTPGWTLMSRAGGACAEEVSRRWPDGPVIVLCGPGANGGDGFVAGQALLGAGRTVSLYFLGDMSRLSGDAETAACNWTGDIISLDPNAASAPRPLDRLTPDTIIIDALFGAGLSRPLDGAALALAAEARRSGARVLSVDTPSGVFGDLSQPGEGAFRADVTVTFAGLKPAHLLEPAASLCGDVVVADIGISDETLESVGARGRLNAPHVWLHQLRWPGRSDHKHRRGRLAVLAGPAGATGAARLAARAGLRTGAGLATLFGAPEAMPELAASSLAVMTRSFDCSETFMSATSDATAYVVGPAAGLTDQTREIVLAILATRKPAVLDADAISVFAGCPDALLDAIHPACVLTPHGGEFSRLFPGVMDASVNKIDAARRAAERCGGVVLLKGADTVIASTQGFAVNVHGSPFLATAGAGDVLAGIIGGWLAQGVDPFSAAAAGAWQHGETSLLRGAGLIAEDLIEDLPTVLTRLHAQAQPAGRHGGGVSARKIISR